MSQKTIIGYWDCNSCNTKKIPGTERNCPHCGTPKGDTKYYLDMEHKEYLNEEKAKSYGKGANWICPYCENQNRYYSTNCESCGSSKKDSVENYFGNNPNKTEYNKEISAEHSVSYYTYEEVHKRQKYEKEAKKINLSSNSSSINRSSDKDCYSKEEDNDCKGIGNVISNFFFNYRKQFLIGVSSVIIIVSIIMMLIMILAPRTYSAIVTANSWERNISIEQV